MRGSQQWSVEATELGHTIALFRAAPAEVLGSYVGGGVDAEHAVLGDPLPGRSALDAKRRKSPH
jgi:hypothetical protein